MKVRHTTQYSAIDYQETLLNASKSMIRVKDPITLLRLITRFVDRQIGATHVAILLYEKKKNSFVLIDSKGEAGRRIPVGYIRMDDQNPLIRYFKTRRNGNFARKDAIVLKDLDHVETFEIYVNKRETQAIEIDDIKKQMALYRAVICVPSYFKQDLLGLMLLGDKLSSVPYTEDEIKLFATLANDVAMAVTNAELIKDLKEAYDKEHQLLIDTASALASAIDARDRYTKGHSERVSHYSLVVAAELIEKGIIPVNREFLEAAQLSGLLHDVGKIGIKDSILNKPARLDDQEFEIMKTHVKIGGHIIKNVKGLKGLWDGILYHHERWDGKGYPHGLKGEEIPIIGRIVCMVDSYDTMVTERPYSKAMTQDQAFEELRRCAGGQFDPKLVELFEEAYRSGRITKRSYATYDFALRQRHS